MDAFQFWKHTPERHHHPCPYFWSKRWIWCCCLVSTLFTGIIVLALADWEQVDDPQDCTSRYCPPDAGDNSNSIHYQSTDPLIAGIGMALIIVALIVGCSMCICFCCDFSYYGRYHRERHAAIVGDTSDPNYPYDVTPPLDGRDRYPGKTDPSSKTTNRPASPAETMEEGGEHQYKEQAVA